MLIAAAFLSLLWTLVHVVLGGAQVERPLARAPLPAAVRETAVMVWHMISAVLIVLTGLLGWAAWSGDGTAAVAGGLLAAALCLSGLGTALLRRTGFALLPQGWLFLPVAALAFAGAWA